MLNSALISPTELLPSLQSTSLKLIDATWFLPPTTRDARAEFEAAHLEGAVYFDIDAVSDTTSSLPHMLPEAEAFAAEVGALGISETDTVVVYDTHGIFSAPRVWWMFMVFGHQRVAVLDGGLRYWQALGLPVTNEVTPLSPVTYTARFQPERVCSAEQVLADLQAGVGCRLDARPAGRYNGTAPEPRPGLRSGHIPASLSSPWSDWVDSETGCMVPSERRQQMISALGLTARQPITAYCGSGVSACVVALGLALEGYAPVTIYDGSWAEWGADSSLPLEV